MLVSVTGETREIGIRCDRRAILGGTHRMIDDVLSVNRGIDGMPGNRVVFALYQ